MEHNSESFIVVKEFTDKGKTIREVIAKGVTKQGFIDAYNEKGCVMRGDENPHFEDIYSGVVYKLENHFEQGGKLNTYEDLSKEMPSVINENSTCIPIVDLALENSNDYGSFFSEKITSSNDVKQAVDKILQRISGLENQDLVLTLLLSQNNKVKGYLFSYGSNPIEKNADKQDFFRQIVSTLPAGIISVVVGNTEKSNTNEWNYFSNGISKELSFFEIRNLDTLFYDYFGSKNSVSFADSGKMRSGGLVANSYPDLSKEMPSFVSEIDKDFSQNNKISLVKKDKFCGEIPNKIERSFQAAKLFYSAWNKQKIGAVEEMFVLLLTATGRIISLYKHSLGARAGTILDNTIVSAVAVQSKAKGVIVCHNHPSGNLQPSQADIKVTRNLKEALFLCGINLVDSIIITPNENSFTSIFEEGLIMKNGGKIIYADGGQVDRERDIQIAKTILMQLGGSNRLQKFTGAYNFVAVPNGVSFRIKNQSVNYVKIVLNAMDTYDIEFGLIRGTNYKIVKELSGIYNDQLVEIFTRYTGMVLRLRKGGAIQGEENAEMVMNQNLQIRHHTEELEEILKSGKEVPAWVVSKVSRAADSMSDATHYLEGTPDKMARGGGLNRMMANKFQKASFYFKELENRMSEKQKKFFNANLKRRQPSFEKNFNDTEIANYINGEIEEQFGIDLGIKKYDITGKNWFKLGFKFIAYRESIEEPEFWEDNYIPQNIPNPEPEPEPHFNIEQLKGEIEALKELLPFLEGDDKKEIEEQIEILNITLMQNDNFGGGVGRSTITDLADFDPETTLVFDGDANFNAFPEITHLGNLQEIKGDANFKNSQVKRIGNLQTIGGDAYFGESQVQDLGNLQTIGGNALFNFSQVQNLGNLQTIGGTANFENSQVQSLGNLQTIGRQAYFRNSQVKSLGNLQTIGGDAFFNESQVQDLGNLQTIGRNAYFAGRDDLKAEWKARQEADTQLESLKDKIRTISKKIEYNGEKGYGGYVVYLGGDKIQIDNHSNLSPYSAQASDSEVKVSFNAPNSTMVIFSNRVDERFEDNESFEKYGGLKYIFEPLTNKIASEILDKTFATDRYEGQYADGGEVGDVYTLKNEDDTWYLTYIDSTHFFLSNTKEYKGSAYHIGQFRTRPFYNEVLSWLKSHKGQQSYAEGGGVYDSADGISPAIQKAFNSLQNEGYFEKEAIEYVGGIKEWNKLSAREKEIIISDIEKDWSKSTFFAEGGGVGKMAMGGSVSKQYESIPNTTYQLKIQVYYDKGGINYFSGGVYKRGYYISVTPVQIERQGNNVVIESYTAFSGIKKLILEVERQSPKSAERAKELAESSIPELKQYVLNQMIERGEIPQDMPNPEPEPLPEPDFNIEQLKGEIEALKELLPFLEGDDKKEIEEQIDILNITLMQNDNFGGGAEKEEIKQWYRINYPDDDLGNELNDAVTFEDLWNVLHNGSDVYEIIGVWDSDIRENLFWRLSEIYGEDYDYVYQKWLDSDEPDAPMLVPTPTPKYAEGGGVGNFPPKGELKNKENLLLKYEKIGSDYEFFVYKPEKKDVSSYEQIKYVCVNKDCPTRMSYNQFLNYLYAETYLDDRKYAKGGGVGTHIDLFEDYENMPPKIAKIFDKYSEDFEDGNYKGLSMALKEMQQLGYTFEYYLDGQAYGLRPIGVPLNQLKGYEDFEEDYAKGGEIASIFSKAKNFGKRTLKKGVELGKSAKQKTEDAIRKKKKEIALDILWEVKENLAEGRDEKIALEKSFAVVDDRYEKGGEVFVCPVGTQIQSLIFDKSMFNLRQAKAWAKKNNFENDFVDGKLNTLRIRQKDPAMFTEDGFRTIQLRQGVQAVIGCPKKRTIRRKK